jgi:hypothetical protein
MANCHVTAERLRELLNYNHETGVFTWLVTAGRRRAGNEAGWLTNGHNGIRRTIEVEQRNYKAHRLAWFYVNGKWPCGVIDHINGNPADNRIENLRDVTQKVNIQNEKVARKKTKSGLLGAHWIERDKKWAANIRVDGRTIRLGAFQSPEEAHYVYLEAKRRLHEGCTI